MSFQNGLLCPLVLGLGSFSLFLFSPFGFEHHCIGFFFMLKIFGSFGFFFMPTQFCLGTLMIENFLLCPPSVAWELPIVEVFSISLALAPSMGCDPSQGFFFKKKCTRLKKGPQRIYFSFVKGLSKMTFLHFKLMHLGLVGFAFMRVCKVISHYSFK